jgi:hypothetical protein
MGSIRMKTEVLQPNPDVTLQSSGINLIAVPFQKSPYRSVYYSTLIQCEPSRPNPVPYFSP